MRYKNIIVWLIVIILGMIPVYAAEGAEQEEIKRANLTLEQMTYEHIEYSDIEQLISKAQDIIGQDNQIAFYEWEESYYELFCKLQLMIQIAHLKYELYTDQTEYFEEYLYSVDLLGKMKAQYISLFEGQNELSSSMNEYYQLSIERDKLVDSYYNQEMAAIIDLNGEMKNIVEILKTDSLNKAEKLKYYDEWYTSYNKATGEIFLELVSIDKQMAKLQGYESYADYMYKGYERDYSLEESKVFFESVKKWIPGLLVELYQCSKDSNALQAYAYESESDLLATIKNTFISHYTDLEEAYDYLMEYHLYDIIPRANKESGGFTVYLEEVKEPFILLNYYNHYQTVLSFIHEFGHYFSYFEIGTHEGGLDLDETYSQALQLLAMPYYKDILGSAELGEEAGLYVLLSLVEVIIDGCLYDEFLQEIYSRPEITVEEMNELYTALSKEYGIKADGRGWCNISHNFEMPFYYLSYSVSAVAALEIWEQSVESPDKGIETYLNLIQAGKKSSFIEALEKTGLANPLEEMTLKGVVEKIESYLNIRSVEKAA